MVRFQKFDGRWLVAVALVCYFSSLLLGHFLLHQPIYRVWAKYQIPANPTQFRDLWDVIAGTQAFRAGNDPWKAPPGNDPWDLSTYDSDHRPFNYPRWWLYTDRIGLNEGTLNGFGIGMGLLFFVCAFFVLGPLTLAEGLLAGSFLVSTCVMFGVERANIDLVIFSLLTLALAWRRWTPVHCLVISLAAILKLYPAFGLLTLVTQEWRRTLSWLVASAGLLLAYFILNIGELSRIAIATPHASEWSYGSAVAIKALHDFYLHAGRLHINTTILAISDLIVLGVMVFAVWKRPRAENRIDRPEWQRELCAFRLGAGIYLGTFALGTNWDYRIVFLAFCLPLLFRLRNEKGEAQVWAIIALILTLVYANAYLLFGLSDCILKEMLAWGLVFTLTGLLSCALLGKGPECGSLSLGPADRGLRSTSERSSAQAR